MGRPLPVVRDVIDGYVLPDAVSIWPDMAGVMAAMRRARTAFVFIADSRLSLSAEVVSRIEETENRTDGSRVTHLDITINTHYDVPMRTTLTLDDDVAERLREQARLQDRTFKQVVNDTLRRGMSPDAGDIPTPEYRVVPNHSALAPGIDPTKLNQINDQLEAETFGGAPSAI